MMKQQIVAVALLGIASTAHADDTHELSIGTTTRALRATSANALTEDSLAGGSLAYAHSLGLQVLLPGLQLWGEAGFGWGSADGSMFQTMRTELDTLSFTVGGRARYPLRKRLIATGRVDLGMARAAVAIRDSAGHTARDAGWGATSAATLGVDFLAIRAPRFSLGVRFEMGVVAQSPIDLTAEPESSDDDTLKLQMSAAGLGSLNLSGGTFAFSVVSVF